MVPMMTGNATTAVNTGGIILTTTDTPRLHFWPAVDGRWIAKASQDGVYVRVPGTLPEPRLPGLLVWKRLMHSLEIAVRAKERVK